MAFDVRLGIFLDRIVEGGKEYEVRREKGGWRTVGPARGGSARVQYDGWRDVLHIESAHGPLFIRFRWRKTTFLWRGKSFRLSSSAWSGRTAIVEGDRPVFVGRLTWSGIRIDHVGQEFQDIRWELALGLAQRAAEFAAAMAVAGA